MLTQKELDKALQAIQNRLDAVNLMYIRKVATQVKKIGELNQSSVNRLVALAEVDGDADEITKALAVAMGETITDVQKIYKAAMQEAVTDPRFTAYYAAGVQVPPAAKARLNQLVASMALQTAQNMVNFSNTTAISQTYRDTVDRGIMAVTAGLTDYKAATRDAIRSLGGNGIQVVYASGYHRRLDTAVRQNIIDGTNQISQQGANIVGEALGYDAVEISAHAHSAPDHEPVQGRVFLKAEYDKMQAGLPFVDVNGNAYAGFRRPIQEWNCQHFALPFSTKYSQPRWGPAIVQQWAADNAKGCTINGKHYTTYQAQQLMRQIETQSRRWKDTANAARAAGDDVLRRQCQDKINTLAAQYAKVSAASGLREHRDRMSVHGFKRMK